MDSIVLHHLIATSVQYTKDNMIVLDCSSLVMRQEYSSTVSPLNQKNREKQRQLCYGNKKKNKVKKMIKLPKRISNN